MKLDEKITERAQSRQTLLELRKERSRVAAAIERGQIELHELDRKVASEQRRLVEVTTQVTRLMHADLASINLVVVDESSGEQAAEPAVAVS